MTHPNLAEYVCHKHVRAMKIATISDSDGDFGEHILTSDEGVVVSVPSQFVQKHHPHVGGYYVRYDDDYESFSPAKPFEAGYERVSA